MNRFDIDQALAGKSTNTEKVLVQLRSAVAVGVNPALTRKHGVKRRAFRMAGKGRHYTRLQNAIATGNTAPVGVKMWGI